jgi:hypothetical protein
MCYIIRIQHLKGISCHGEFNRVWMSGCATTTIEKGDSLAFVFDFPWLCKVVFTVGHLEMDAL